MYEYTLALPGGSPFFGQWWMVLDGGGYILAGGECW